MRASAPFSCAVFMITKSVWTILNQKMGIKPKKVEFSIPLQTVDSHYMPSTMPIYRRFAMRCRLRSITTCGGGMEAAWSRHA